MSTEIDLLIWRADVCRNTASTDWAARSDTGPKPGSRQDERLPVREGDGGVRSRSRGLNTAEERKEREKKKKKHAVVSLAHKETEKPARRPAMTER